MGETDLDLVETQDLVDALIRRTSGLVLLVTWPPDNDDPDRFGAEYLHYDIPVCQAIGMLEVAKATWLQEWLDLDD